MNTKGITGGWSKWGGARKQAMQPKIDGLWHCQSCAKEQHPSMPPYTYQLAEGEHIRVCATCLKDGCATLWKRRKRLEH